MSFHFLHHKLFRNHRLILCFFILIASGLIFYSCLPLVTTHYTIHSKTLPVSFDHFRIIQLSDLHESTFGQNQSKLIKKIVQENPNIIVITGDLISAGSYAFESTLTLLRQLLKIAPTYYSLGNHEVFMTYRPDEAAFFETVKELGVVILDNQITQISSDTGESINLIGLTDPVDVNASSSDSTPIEYQNLLNSISILYALTPNDFNLLLAHRPEYIETYSEFPIQLVLSGHAHGGIIQIPFIGGLYAPNQGFFPKYTSGKHKINNTQLIISRGLGTSSFPLRILNPPQLISITLSCTN